jgi:hypothetical protein
MELERYFAVLPALRSPFRKYEYADARTAPVETPYNSAVQPTMERDELLAYLRQHSFFEDE